MPILLGPTISPISSSSSSSTSSGTRTWRLTDAAWPSPSSSEELVDRESGGLNPEFWNVGECLAFAEPKSLFGNAELPPSASSSIPAITKGLVGQVDSWSSVSSPLVSLSPSGFSDFSFWAARRAASWRRAREGPRLSGAGGGGKMGIGWLAEFDDT